MEIIANTERLRAITGGMLRPGGFRITDRGLSFCNFRDQARIIDAGCGNGLTTQYLADRYTKEAYGIDFSGQLLREARMRHKDVPFIQARLESLPFNNGTFDAVICECVLSYTSVLTTLKEFMRVLRGGGFLILSDIYWKATQSIMREGAIGLELNTEAQIMWFIRGLNFVTLHWEDRTADLKSLAAHLVMDLDGARQMSPSCDQFFCARSGLWRGIGYYLLVAKKMAMRAGNKI